MAYPNPIISNIGIGTVPEIGPDIRKTGHVHYKPRVLIGWIHQNDTPDGREKGKIWCWVSQCDYLQVYDENFNRSEVPGEVRFCGCANFTMVRMFHPYWAIRGGPPRDKDKDDKQWCRDQYRALMRDHGRNNHDPRNQRRRNPDNDSDNSDSSNDSDGSGNSNAPRPQQPDIGFSQPGRRSQGGPRRRFPAKLSRRRRRDERIVRREDNPAAIDILEDDDSDVSDDHDEDLVRNIGGFSRRNNLGRSRNVGADRFRRDDQNLRADSSSNGSTGIKTEPEVSETSSSPSDRLFGRGNSSLFIKEEPLYRSASPYFPPRSDINELDRMSPLQANTQHAGSAITDGSEDELTAEITKFFKETVAGSRQTNQSATSTTPAGHATGKIKKTESTSADLTHMPQKILLKKISQTK